MQEQKKYEMAKEKGIFKTFEEIFKGFSEEEKRYHLERYNSMWEKEKIVELVKEEKNKIEKDRDYWKNRFEDLQNKMEDPLDEIFEGKLINVNSLKI